MASWDDADRQSLQGEKMRMKSRLATYMNLGRRILVFMGILLQDGFYSQRNGHERSSASAEL